MLVDKYITETSKQDESMFGTSLSMHVYKSMVNKNLMDTEKTLKFNHSNKIKVLKGVL